MADLTSVEGVETYLSRTPFAASSVFPLSGGLTNFVYRIILQEPYSTDSVAPVHTVIFKHAKPYVAAIKEFLYTTERQDFESMALKHVPGLTYSETAVSVPKLYYEDRENRVLLLSDSGVTSTTLKALFQTTPPTTDVSRIIGKSLGSFLARLHQATFALDSSGSAIKDSFEANQTARRATGQVTYGTLISTVAPKDKEPRLIEPPLDLSPTELNALTTLATTMQNRIMTSDEILAMGDFWPGNIMISFSPELALTVVDWETARPGLAGLEIGQFLAEMYSLGIFHPSCLASVDAVVSSFLVAYRDIALQGRTTEEVSLDIAWTATTHFGTHLVTWTPRVPWGTKEQTRKVVLEGLNSLLRVADRDEAWLRASIVRELLP